MKKVFTFIIALMCSASLLFAADLTVTGSFPDNAWNNANPDYQMSEIGTTGVYMLEKTLPAGAYEFKVLNTGTWVGYEGANRKFELTNEESVRFYAKKNGDKNRFFSSAEEIYVMGDAVGGWDEAKLKLMTNSTTEATYTADVVAGNYKLIVINQDNSILYNEITPDDLSVPANGNYSIKLDFATFAVSATPNGEVDPTLSALSSSYISIGETAEVATWYNASGTEQSENFDGKELGTVMADELFVGGQILSTPILDDVVVKMHYQIDELGVNEVLLPFAENVGENAKWMSTTGVNVFDGYILTEGQTYNLNVWFSATKGETTIWDSNNSANYVASFTYKTAAEPTLSALFSSYVFVGKTLAEATWYNASGIAEEHDNFDGNDLGSLIYPIYLGAEIQTTAIVTDVEVKMHYQVDELSPREVILPFAENIGTATKWQSTEGVNSFADYGLVKGKKYSLKVWFTATKDETILYDSNDSKNYIATFTYDINTNLRNTTQDAVKIYSENGLRVVLTSKSKIELFSISGQKIQDGMYENEFNIELNKGIYILHINGLGYKVAIR